MAWGVMQGPFYDEKGGQPYSLTLRIGKSYWVTWLGSELVIKNYLKTSETTSLLKVSLTFHQDTNFTSNDNGVNWVSKSKFIAWIRGYTKALSCIKGNKKRENLYVGQCKPIMEVTLGK